jgi:hypothetical protein
LRPFHVVHPVKASSSRIIELQVQIYEISQKAVKAYEITAFLRIEEKLFKPLGNRARASFN